MCKGRDVQKLNNNGFSLLEVLIAMVILCVVSIPLLHSFVTTAKTNGRAKILMRATDCAENLMESAEYKSVEEMVEYYRNSGNTINEKWGYDKWNELLANQPITAADSQGAYVIELTNPADIPIPLPDGYKVYMMLDPNLYPNANGLNVADVQSLSVEDTAVYEMSSLYDETVYNRFAEWSKTAYEDKGYPYKKEADYFKENLTRTMEITIDKKGEELGTDGDIVDLVTVKLDIRYHFRTAGLYQNILPKERSTYTEETKELYNNLSSKESLDGIFVFYQPRYKANNAGNKDNIIINNPDNVSVNVMLAAQPGATDASLKSLYFNATTGPNVTVVENPTGGIAGTDAATTLFTNLSETAPYSAVALEDGTIPDDGEVLCNLTYQNPAGTQKKTGNDAVKCLDVRNLDGKNLIGDNVGKRIYKIAVAILDQQGNLFLELDGTKLE